MRERIRQFAIVRGTHLHLLLLDDVVDVADENEARLRTHEGEYLYLNLDDDLFRLFNRDFLVVAIAWCLFTSGGRGGANRIELVDSASSPTLHDDLRETHASVVVW